MLECIKTYISKNIYEILYHNNKTNYKHWSVLKNTSKIKLYIYEIK